MKVLTWLRKSVNFFSVLFAVSLILSSAAAFISPSKIWVLSFFGLTYLPFLLINIFFAVFWIIVRIRHAVMPLIALVFSLIDFTGFFAFHFGSSNSFKKEDGIRVMSYNVRNFDLYNWSQNEETRKKMFELIKMESPDIVCFQEFYSEDKGDFPNERTITEQLHFPYHHFEITQTLRKNNHWGMATFSKFPIVNHQRIVFKNKTRNSAMFTDIQIGDSIVRVYNIHLQSIFFGKNDYKYIDSVAANQELKYNRTKQVVRKMKSAFVFRGEQADTIAESVTQSPYPVIVCGDFNDTPSSYAYHTIRGNLQDAFTKKSWGIGHSYNRFLPIFRIDYVLPDNHFEVMNYSTVHQKYSDHYPVIVDLTRKKN